MATARTEAERLWVWRENGFMRVAATRPAGIACTEYAKVKEIGANAKATGEPEPVKTQVVNGALDDADDVTKHALQDHCKHLVAPYKYPRDIEFVAELPKTVSGKTRRFELRQRQAKNA